MTVYTLTFAQNHSTLHARKCLCQEGMVMKGFWMQLTHRWMLVPPVKYCSGSFQRRATNNRLLIKSGVYPLGCATDRKPNPSLTVLQLHVCSSPFPCFMFFPCIPEAFYGKTLTLSLTYLILSANQLVISINSLRSCMPASLPVCLRRRSSVSTSFAIVSFTIAVGVDLVGSSSLICHWKRFWSALSAWPWSC